MALAERRDCRDHVSVFVCSDWQLLRVGAFSGLGGGEAGEVLVCQTPGTLAWHGQCDFTFQRAGHRVCLEAACWLSALKARGHAVRLVWELEPFSSVLGYLQVLPDQEEEGT